MVGGGGWIGRGHKWDIRGIVFVFVGRFFHTDGLYIWVEGVIRSFV